VALFVFVFLSLISVGWAESKTLEGCRAELRSTTGDFLLLGLQLGHKLPVIDGIN
jgi:hypothetical protein